MSAAEERGVPMWVAIDLHKGMTAPVMLGAMAALDVWTPTAWLYLALHGSYGLLWVYKSNTFPDPAWNRRVSVPMAVFYWLALALYWVAPALVLTGRGEAPGWVMGLSTALVVLGTMLHFGSDAQKFYLLQARRGLITDGFFARTRNPNYLGEMMIYGGFAALSMHWAPHLVNLAYWAFVFWPNMRKKDASMSRYPEWAAYVARTGLLFPRLGR